MYMIYKKINLAHVTAALKAALWTNSHTKYHISNIYVITPLSLVARALHGWCICKALYLILTPTSIYVLYVNKCFYVCITKCQTLHNNKYTYSYISFYKIWIFVCD